MKKGFLLDTNIVLYWFFDSAKLKHLTKKIRGSALHVSVFSLWEIAIKSQIGKLKLPIPLDEYFNEIENNFQILNWNVIDILIYAELPLLHRDPFDRIMIAQAKSNKLCLISADKQLTEYKIDKIIV